MVIEVADNGIGIPHRMLSKIFELFVQEERAFRKSSSGLGIGLSLVSQLVSLHGGTTKVSSNGTGQGSEFVLRLPLVDIPVIAISESIAQASGTERILIVDDNRDSTDATTMLMAGYGYEVRTAYDFESALREATSFVPDIALLDLSKPQPDGLELAQRFQQMAEMGKTILIAFSGYGQPDDIERSKKAGFAHHLVKPGSADAINKLIRSMKSKD